MTEFFFDVEMEQGKKLESDAIEASPWQFVTTNLIRKLKKKMGQECMQKNGRVIWFTILMSI